MEHNSYYDGKVQSLGFNSERGEATVGVAEPGTYTVPIDSEEHLKILSGTGRVKITGQDWKTLSKGDTIVIPRGVEVTYDVQQGPDLCYLCYFK